MTGWTHTGYAQRLVFGAGAVATVGEVCAGLGMGRVLVVTTAGRRASASLTPSSLRRAPPRR